MRSKICILWVPFDGLEYLLLNVASSLPKNWVQTVLELHVVDEHLGPKDLAFRWATPTWVWVTSDILDELGRLVKRPVRWDRGV